MTLIPRLLRELKASGPKSAVLGVLVLVGLYFWIPPLWRAATGSAAAAEPVAIPAPSAVADTPPPITSSASNPINWHDAERARTEDPLFRPADETDVRANAFVFDRGFLPLDVEFGEAPARPATATASPTADEEVIAGTAESAPAPLTLTSTLVGSNRRVAVINDRVYAEGAVVAAAGQTWTVLNVESRRVLLDGAGGTLELRIDPFGVRQDGR